MHSDPLIYDVIIVGAGPCGLAMGVEASKNGLSHLILEKGSLTESIRRYPRNMRFFSTVDNIAIGGLPFTIADFKANREEALQYYRKVAGYYNLNFKLFTTVTTVSRDGEGRFEVESANGEVFKARKVVLATGYFDIPNRLGIPGEDLPHVAHYYEEAYRYSFTDVVLVGGANSVVEAALELYRTDARVTIVHRGDDLRKTVKYWLVPDVKNRIREGRIQIRYSSVVNRITPEKILITNQVTGEQEWLPAAFVFLLTGYTPDEHLLARCGVAMDPETKVPVRDPDTYETNVPGLYLCGTVMAGVFTEKVFIENGREHAAAIADHIAGRPVRKVNELLERL